jgi:hypothetical protein
MPKIKMLRGNGPVTVYGPKGVEVTFGRDNMSNEVSQKAADFFSQVPGYEIIDDRPKDADPDIEDFRKLSWQKQNYVLQGSSAPLSWVKYVVENQSLFKDSTIKIAKAILER